MQTEFPERYITLGLKIAYYFVGSIISGGDIMQTEFPERYITLGLKIAY